MTKDDGDKMSGALDMGDAAVWTCIRRCSSHAFEIGFLTSTLRALCSEGSNGMVTVGPTTTSTGAANVFVDVYIC
jgi:hypothetical protein